MSDLILIQPTHVELTTATGTVGVREVELGGVPRGLVLVLTDRDAPEILVLEAVNRLAEEGYESLAAPAVEADLDVVLERAAERGWAAEQIGVLGVGTGGTLALSLARHHQLGAAISFSAAPDVEAVVDAPELRTPWLGMFGAEAGDLSRGETVRLTRALDAGSDVFSRVVTYPGVGRDFHRRSEDGISFAASYDGWQRALEWLNARVAARLTPLALRWRAHQGESAPE